jgi:calcineurin-like phosphoesterase family protein
MSQELVEHTCSVTKKGDLLYMLGDVCWKTDVAVPVLQALKKHGLELHLIEGNHDHRLSATAKKQFFTTVHSGLYILHENDLRISLSHFPMLSWDRSFVNNWQLYGHLHKGSAEMPFIERILKGKALNVNVEFHDYTPWSFDELVEYMEQRPSNMDADELNAELRRRALKEEWGSLITK